MTYAKFKLNTVDAFCKLSDKQGKILILEETELKNANLFF